MTADAYGGLDGEFPLASVSAPGVYQLQIANLGGGSFRVEENQQPEFEVSIEPPIKPVRLGDKIRAMIRARHEDGSPVAKAKVEYKVLHWAYAPDLVFPPDPWDWLYGRGYWWFGYDRPWLAGWRGGGAGRGPAAAWRPRREEPPEVAGRSRNRDRPGWDRGGRDRHGRWRRRCIPTTTNSTRLSPRWSIPSGEGLVGVRQRAGGQQAVSRLCLC